MEEEDDGEQETHTATKWSRGVVAHLRDMGIAGTAGRQADNILIAIDRGGILL